MVLWPVDLSLRTKRPRRDHKIRVPGVRDDVTLVRPRVKGVRSRRTTIDLNLSFLLRSTHSGLRAGPCFSFSREVDVNTQDHWLGRRQSTFLIHGPEFPRVSLLIPEVCPELPFPLITVKEMTLVSSDQNPFVFSFCSGSLPVNWAVFAPCDV